MDSREVTRYLRSPSGAVAEIKRLREANEFLVTQSEARREYYLKLEALLGDKASGATLEDWILQEQYKRRVVEDGWDRASCDVEMGSFGVRLLSPSRILDERGYFSQLPEIDFKTALVNTSYSREGCIRGMHYQLSHPQQKLIRVVSGKIWDVALDVRIGSSTFGSWVGHLLDSERQQCLLIPSFCAHGFVVLSKAAEVMYLCSDSYHPEDQFIISYRSVSWPLEPTICSDRDGNAFTLNEVLANTPSLLPSY